MAVVEVNTCRVDPPALLLGAAVWEPLRGAKSFDHFGSGR